MVALITLLFESILFLVCLPAIINILTLNKVEIIEDEETSDEILKEVEE